MTDYSLTVSFVEGLDLFPSRVIEAYERFSPWSHCEFLFEATHETFGAQLEGGVGWRNLSAKCYRHVKRRENWRVPLTEKQWRLADKAIEDLNGQPYDWRAIATFPLGPYRWRTKGAHICSGAVIRVFRAAKMLKLEFTDDTFNPADVRLLVPNLPGSEKI